MSETARVSASIVVAELLSCAYDLPANARFALPMLTAGVKEATTPVKVEWHSNGLELRLTNSFDVGLDFGPLGDTKRWGFEGVRGTLALMADGSYRGAVRARTWSGHVGGGLGKRCPEAESEGTQWLMATARPVERLNASQDPSRFTVRQGATDGGYLQLTFKPLTAPVFSSRDACQDADELLFRTCESCLRFLPFNDARWTTPEHAFVIAIPRDGKLVYDDRSLADIAPPAELGPFLAVIKGTWTKTKIDIERTDTP
jgi:hypothetical protein